MNRLRAFLVAVAISAVGTHAFAQEVAPVVVTIIPGGGTFFTEAKDTTAPSFANYELGGSVVVNLNRFVGIEGEVTSSLGITQDFTFQGQSFNQRTPSLLNYSGNVVVSAVNHTAVVPYVTGGVGGLTLFEKTALGIPDNETFFTGNVGGGVKWFRGRWGLRGDYRFIAVQSKDDAPPFFGQETRYGHRVYGGVLLSAGR